MLTSLLAGIAMAVLLMLVATVLGKGFLTPLYLIAAPFTGADAATTSTATAEAGDPLRYAPGAVTRSALVHLTCSLLFGAVFASLTTRFRVAGPGVLAAGVLYALSVMLVMSFVVLPLGAEVLGGGAVVADIAAQLAWATWIVPLALPLALLTAVGRSSRSSGAITAGALAALAALAALVALVSNGPVTALVVVGATVLVQQLEGNLLQPVVMGRTLDLHPVVVMVALAVGGILGGIVGAFLAVPVVAIAIAGIGGWADAAPHEPASDRRQDRAPETAADEPRPRADEPAARG